ncbi:protein tyrosine kinase [Fragilaria crotonensis]|nr:protein tyrosine kinase [Fragilaria crotonensis]
MSQLSLEKRTYASVESLSDYGFHFERDENSGDSTNEPTEEEDESNDDDNNTSSKMVQFEPIHQQEQSDDDDEDNVSSSCSSDDGSLGTVLSEKSDAESSVSKTPSEPKLRHILYIQMQLCGQKTLANFLCNHKARCTPDGTEVDIHYALKLFHHIAMGVKYVHSQDLIHRDLKPNNCFMDDSGIVKVGDFGLSRETNNLMNTSLRAEEDRSLSNGDGEENTAGVGTRAYASPEQIKGSDYDNSTDIYSLGFILFELTFRMSTGMERHIMFSRLRQGVIPDEWATNVAGSFPFLTPCFRRCCLQSHRNVHLQMILFE